MPFEYYPAMPEQTLTIPYSGSRGYGSGVPNIGFIDLVNEPQRITEIPELKGFPELQDFVIYINTAPSAFFSMRVDSGYDFFPQNVSEHSCFTFTTVGLHRLHEQQDRVVFELLRDRFEEYISILPLGRLTDVIFRLSGLRIANREDWRGFCLDIWIHGYGLSRVAARSAWLKSFNMVINCFKQFHTQLIANVFDDLISGVNGNSDVNLPGHLA